MHIEIRKKEGIKKYYLAQSIRKSGKVSKLRVYLGSNLSEAELQRCMEEARIRLNAGVDASKQISDPFETVLSAEELKELKTLEAKGTRKNNAPFRG